MRSWKLLALLPSVLLYVFQITTFTSDQEVVIYGALGLALFALVIRNPNLPPALTAFAIALALGFVPHRLRMGGEISAAVVAFPGVHFIAMYIYLYRRQVR